MRVARWKPLIAAGLAVSAAGCSCSPPADGAIHLEVQVVGLKSGCLEILAADAEAPASGPVSSTLALDTSTPGRTYNFAVLRKAGWSHTVSVEARVHEGGCSGVTLASQKDDAVEVPAATIVGRSFTLTVSDGDGDGYAAPSAGGTDCAPLDPAIHPGTPELCGNGVDDDCNGLVDCADPGCASKACDDGDACTLQDVCGPGGCAGTPVACTTPPTVCSAATGTCGGDGGCGYALLAPNTPCGAGLVCNNAGTCVGQNTEFNCLDGIDNDSDTLIDCADPDCLNVLCDAGLCVTGEVCQAGGACQGGAAVTCAGPASTCLDAGVCDSNSGVCNYPPLPAGAGCTDSNLCTSGDQCNGAGACVGTAMQCNTPGACEQATGGCDAGTCVYAAAVGGPCDDLMACTHTDVCSAARTCSGTTYACGPAPECALGAGTCLGDGGCGYAPDPARDFQNCDAGFCFSGTCFGFTYSPSNHVPAAVPPGGNVLINCAMTFNTFDGGMTSNWCGNPAPNVYVITQSASAEPAVVLSMRGLTITDAGNLRLVGSRPVIFSVLGWTTVIDGVIDARAELNVNGAGGGRPTCGAQQGGDGGEDVGGVHGTGAGGGGFRTRGADGGLPNPAVAAAGAGGAQGPANLTPLVGGCNGGHGGPGRYDGGIGGAGGGAVQISAAGSLLVSATGKISVSGGGSIGPATASRAGGGGGGSAGGVLLEGRVLTVRTGGAVTANGGGGSEGGDDDEPGNSGANGSLATAVPAPGGVGGSGAGGEGGAGAAGIAGPQPGIQNSVGGGGGGAAGLIVFRSTSAGGCVFDGGATVSPPPVGLGMCP